MKKPVDFANLQRVIELGAAEAARDAGLARFVLTVSIQPAVVVETLEILPAIQIEIIEEPDETVTPLDPRAN